MDCSDTDIRIKDFAIDDSSAIRWSSLESRSAPTARFCCDAFDGRQTDARTALCEVSTKSCLQREYEQPSRACHLITMPHRANNIAANDPMPNHFSTGAEYDALSGSSDLRSTIRNFSG